MDYEEGGVERSDTVVRMGFSLLYGLIISVLETVLAAIVIFQLLYTLITRQEPSRRVSDLGNRIAAYFYRMVRFLTYNSDERPFPFTDFPEALEPPYAGEAEEEPGPAAREEHGGQSSA